MRNDISLSDPRIKLLILGLVFVLSTLFFVNTANRFLYPSRAGTELVRAFIDKSEASVNEIGEFTFDLYMVSSRSSLLSGASAVFEYNPNMISFVSSGISETCSANNVAFDELIHVNDEKGVGNTNVITVTRLTKRGNADLASGLMCWGSLTFAIKPGINEGVVKLAKDSLNWEIVGPENVYTVNIDQGDVIKAISSTEVVPTKIYDMSPTPLPIETPIVSPTISLFPYPTIIATPSGGASYTFIPTTLSANVGETVHMDVVLDTGTHTVLAGDIVITYDPQVLRFVSIQKGATPFAVSVNGDSGSGVLRLSALLEENMFAGYSGKGVIVKMQFRAIADGASTFAFACVPGDTAQDSNIAANTIDVDDVIDCSLINTATVLVGSGVGVCTLKGDYNCNNQCDLPDFEVFRREKMGTEKTLRSDGNGDGQITMADFEVWRRCFLQGVE